MKYLDYLQRYDNFDKYLLFLDALGFGDTEISSMTGVTRQTVVNAKKRQETLLEAIKIIKTEPQSYGNAEVNTIVNAFAETFGTTKSNKYDRFAAKRLADKYGAENVATVIRVLGKNSSDRYCPSVNSVRQLEEKWVSVGNFLKRISADTEVIDG